MGSVGRETPRQPIFPLIESSLPISLYSLRGEGDTQGGGRQAAREDGNGGGVKINILGCSCRNKSGGTAKALLQFIIMKN